MSVSVICDNSAHQVYSRYGEEETEKEEEDGDRKEIEKGESQELKTYIMEMVI